MIKLYPSSAAFIEGLLVFTRYSSGCIRSQLLRTHGVREEIKAIHKERGAANEDWYGAELTKGGVEFKREVAFNFSVCDEPNAVLSGRIDYLINPDSDQREIHELKSTESPNVLREVIRKGNYNLANVAQIVCYLMAERCTRGKLVHQYYKKSKAGDYQAGERREFIVTIESDGQILVDGKGCGFAVRNLLEYFTEAAKAIHEGRITPRPAHSEAFDGPCKFCPFSGACDALDLGLVDSLGSFVYLAKQCLEAKSLREKEKVKK